MNIAEILRKLADVVDGAESDSPQDIAQQVPHQDQSAQLHAVEPDNGENKEVINTRSMVAPLQQKLDLMKKLAGVEGACTSCGCDPCGCEPEGKVSGQPDELDIIKQNAGIPTFTIVAADEDEPLDEGFSNYDGTELNFYHVVVDFLIEANTPEEARKKVTEYNFAKVQERGNGWHNFDVIKVKQTQDVI